MSYYILFKGISGSKPTTLILCLLIMLYLWGCKQNDQIQKSTSSFVENNDAKDQTPLQYIVAEEEDISLAGVSRRVVRVIINADAIPEEDDLKNTLSTLWKSNYYRYDEVTVFAYLPEMDTRDVAYSVLEFTPSGLRDFKINDYALWGTKWSDTETKEKEANEKWTNDKTHPMVKDYYVKINCNKALGTSYNINAQTNFPDGTSLLLDVTRTYSELKGVEKYSGEFFSKDLIVYKGQINARVNLDDSIWVREYQRNKRQFSTVIDFPGIGWVSDKVLISVLYSPRRAQSADVKDILGENGEYVKGSGVQRTGTFTTYSEELSISLPYAAQ